MQEKYKILKEKITEYNIAYYEKGISLISDDEYDKLYAELEEMEREHPEFIASSSPTQVVGAGQYANSSGLGKIIHGSPLLSINNKSTSIADLLLWYDKMGGDGTEVLIEPKLDGITINLSYQNGKLIQAATRGNGYIGESVLHNAEQISNISNKIPLNHNSYFEVRGECVIPYDFFKEKLSDNFSNPRNTVAGIMRKLDCKNIAAFGPKIMLYDFGKTEGVLLNDIDSDNIKFLRSLNLTTVPYLSVNSAKQLSDIVSSKMNGYIREIDGFSVLVNNGYPQAVCDGLVIKVNSYNLRDKIGMSEKGPKWAFGYKFKPLSATTRIDHIEWQVGKTGALTPVAVFDEISLGGTKITRATLHNYDYMQNLQVQNSEETGLKCDDVIVVERGNDVIPHITEIVRRNVPVFTNNLETCLNNFRRCETFMMPSSCPVCGARVSGGTCTGLNCKAKLKAKVEHFVSRDAFNITGLGEALIDTLVDLEYIEDLPDVFELSNYKQELMELDGMGYKKYANLVNSAEACKRIDLSRFIYSLSIPGVGLKTAKDLEREYKSLDKFMKARKEDLMNIDGIGDVVAEAIERFVSGEGEIVERLIELGITINPLAAKSDNLAGKTFVITGTLKNSRDYYVKIIENNGGKVSNSVSKKTDFILLGADAGSKETKAKELINKGANIKILDTEEEITKIIGE